MKQHFTCPEQSTGTTVMYVEVKILMMLLHTYDSLKVTLWCILMKNKIISPFFLQEAVVTGDTFLITMENTALHHVTVGAVIHNETYGGMDV